MSDVLNLDNKTKVIIEGNRIVCAANYHPNSPLILGARHWDPLMHANYEQFEQLHVHRVKTGEAVGLFPEGHEFEQGFIDKFGNWLTREEAWVVANAAGQILRRVGGDGGRLYSENLY